ncbi:mitochondrial 54S ribosomal protein uL1m [Phyllosticta citribraziliensis]|uniref:Mitochondrial large ribosomal subunit protein L1 n=1 Tax=Phyllosticta citribraziliensis TaxID=989973 RepID=A0ABR1MAH8_9PEZI
MASTPRCLAHLGRQSLRTTSIRPTTTTLRTGLAASPAPSLLLPLQQFRGAASPAKKKDGSGKKKALSKSFKVPDMKLAIQFPLLDAMRYLRAFEMRYPDVTGRYEVHVRFRTERSGPTIRNRMRLPHPVKVDLRICVIAPRDSPAGQAALKAGAAVVGEDEIFEAVRAGKIDFDRCLAVAESMPKLMKANVARILGPQGLMPSAKMNTVVKDAKDVATAVGDMVGGTEYRERVGVVRMAIGNMDFTPDMLSANIKIFLESVKKDIAKIPDNYSKSIHEVVLSSTHGPGFSLSGEIAGPESPKPEELVERDENEAPAAVAA